MKREELQGRIIGLGITETGYELLSRASFIGGVALGAGAIVGEAIGDPKTAFGLAVGSGMSLAFSIHSRQGQESTQQQVATYEAAQYVVDQLNPPSIPEVE